LTYVRHGIPPIITIHGEKDAVVPYTQAVRLHAALSRVGVLNKLITVPGGGHGHFGVHVTLEAYAEIFKFLKSTGIELRPE
jgi:dipeptidyl aminopeptidase/acylaminoacyl peptidase